MFMEESEEKIPLPDGVVLEHVHQFRLSELTFQTCWSYKSGLMHMLRNYGVALSMEAV